MFKPIKLLWRNITTAASWSHLHLIQRLKNWVKISQMDIQLGLMLVSILALKLDVSISPGIHLTFTNTWKRNSGVWRWALPLMTLATGFSVGNAVFTNYATLNSHLMTCGTWVLLCHPHAITIALYRTGLDDVFSAKLLIILLLLAITWRRHDSKVRILHCNNPSVLCIDCKTLFMPPALVSDLTGCCKGGRLDWH